MIALKKFFKINIIMFICGIFGAFIAPQILDFKSAFFFYYTSFQLLKISAFLCFTTLIIIILQIINNNKITISKPNLIISTAIKILQNFFFLKYILYDTRNYKKIGLHMGFDDIQICYNWKAIITSIFLCGILTSLFFLEKIFKCCNKKRISYLLWIFSCVPILDIFILTFLLIKVNCKHLNNKHEDSFNLKIFLFIINFTAFVSTIIFLLLYNCDYLSVNIDYFVLKNLIMSVEFLIIVVVFDYIIWVNDIY